MGWRRQQAAATVRYGSTAVDFTVECEWLGQVVNSHPSGAKIKQTVWKVG